MTPNDLPIREPAQIQRDCARTDLVFGKEVKVATHGKDRYGRVIGDVFVGGKPVNEIMVRDGWAWNFVKYSKSSRLAGIEREARAGRRGLWAGKSPIAPWDYRAEQAKKRQEKKKSRSRVPTKVGSHRSDRAFRSFRLQGESNPSDGQNP
jgi:hypothetical protein